MSRRRLLGLAVAGLVPGLAGCSDGNALNQTPTPIDPAGTPAVIVPGYDDPRRWAGRTVRVAAWGGEVQQALREAIWQPFANATGCTVQEVTTDYSQLRHSLANGQPYADLLIVDAIWAETALSEGLIDPIPLGTVDVARFAPMPVRECAVPAYSYALVSAFRRDAVLRYGEPQSWVEWWDKQRWGGRRSLPRGAFGTFEIALLADGVSPDRLYPLDGARAVESLKRISGKIVDLWWDSGLQPVSWLSRKRTDFAAAWHYRVVAAKLDGRPIDFIWNQGLLVADCWVIAKAAPGRDAALDLIAYATSPQAQAAVARHAPLGPVTPDAFEFIDRRTAVQLPTEPEHVGRLIRIDTAWWAANKAEANEQFNCWLLGGPCVGPAQTGPATALP